MLKKLLFLLLSAGLLPGLARAQEGRITGRVVNQTTKDPVAFASISLRDEGTGALTNEYGYFQLAMPERSLDDSVVVEALGFRRTAIRVKRGANMEDLIIELPKQSVRLAEVTVKAAQMKPALLGAHTTAPGLGMIQGLPGSQYAALMKNDKQKKFGYIRSVSFYIGENGFPREPFRVRLYRADGNYNAPNSDLLLDNVVVSAARGGGWFDVDLTSYNIPAPDEGFYVAMEWIVSGDKFYTTNFMDNYTPYGQILRPTFEFKDSRTWLYAIGRGWSLITLANGASRYNAMIRAEVDATK
ncbi:carboxypeptidase-like regulatory domain-containing protein [Hymenobacter sp. PAMC 26628]|uniref:carboxypeptidase-like regulatory domain-containing protein n=1 Tax=Hymenobacter sp. PAMC 26628 TaxID=1484118 RepID=UPI0009E9D99E|nr:carboxypeptidase-like regulatory domain-containing protein [Hymenobacter sp. PAMC 26628]